MHVVQHFSSSSTFYAIQLLLSFISIKASINFKILLHIENQFFFRRWEKYVNSHDDLASISIPIHFPAQWCPSCRRTTTNVVEIYWTQIMATATGGDVHWKMRAHLCRNYFTLMRLFCVRVRDVMRRDFNFIEIVNVNETMSIVLSSFSLLK